MRILLEMFGLPPRFMKRPQRIPGHTIQNAATTLPSLGRNNNNNEQANRYERMPPSHESGSFRRPSLRQSQRASESLREHSDSTRCDRANGLVYAIRRNRAHYTPAPPPRVFSSVERRMTPVQRWPRRCAAATHASQLKSETSTPAQDLNLFRLERFEFKRHNTKAAATHATACRARASQLKSATSTKE